MERPKLTTVPRRTAAMQPVKVRIASTPSATPRTTMPTASGPPSRSAHTSTAAPSKHHASSTPSHADDDEQWVKTSPPVERAPIVNPFDGHPSASVMPVRLPARHAPTPAPYAFQAAPYPTAMSPSSIMRHRNTTNTPVAVHPTSHHTMRDVEAGSHAADVPPHHHPTHAKQMKASSRVTRIVRGFIKRRLVKIMMSIALVIFVLAAYVSRITSRRHSNASHRVSMCVRRVLHIIH
jgi:hypothetical protein